MYGQHAAQGWRLTPQQAAVMAAQELARREARRKFDRLYPDSGPLRRELYPQHLRFFALGARFKTRAFMAANRIGKTEGGGGYELTCHLTGRYPAWWEGYRFARPIDAWLVGDTLQTVRDIIQAKLFGPPDAPGTGIVPGDLIGRTTLRQNGGGAYDTVLVRHVSGGWSRVGLKSYDQGRSAFQGTEKDVVWLDEEAPEEVRSECATRLMTTGGLLIETFTPLRGFTKVVQLYRGEGATMTADRVFERDGRVMVQAGWQDVPHIHPEEKERLRRETPPHLRDAREFGEPSMGAGAIYPVPESELLVDPFPLPQHWPLAYAMDVGWRRTAALWAAVSRDDGGTMPTVYLVSEHYRGQAEPAVHAQAIRSRGEWIPGVIDPAARGRGQKDGEQLLRLYRDLGLHLMPADNAVEAGIYDVWQLISTGHLKVFKTLQAFRAEYRMYRRDERGNIVKENDHLMDCLRYLVRSGLRRARTRPAGRVPVVAPQIVLDEVIGY